MWAFRAFPYPGFFHLCLQFFRSVDWNKVMNRCLNALTLNLSYMWAWSVLTYLGLFGRFMCSNVSRTRNFVNRNRQVEVFLYLSQG